MSTTPENPPQAPHWDTIREDIHCPLCAYNLRGLAESRCPECGFHFAWPDLLDPRRRKHPYLFEHHPECNVRSYWRTLTGSLRPTAFWSSLHPVQPSSPRRLFAYGCVPVLVLLLVCGGRVAKGAHDVYAEWLAIRSRDLAWLNSPINTQRARQITNRFGGVNAYINTVYRRPTVPQFLGAAISSQSQMRFAIALAGAVAAWPWLTYVTLLIFQISMRRARVQRSHIRRCAIYCLTPSIWASTGAMIVSIAYSFIDWRGRLDQTALIVPLAIVGVMAGGLVILGLFGLSVAYRDYLRFDRPFLTVLASQIIVALALINVTVAWRVWTH